MYVVDEGLGRVVVFYREEDGQESAEVLGEQGSREGQFQVGKFSGEEYKYFPHRQDPSGLVVDEAGNLVVVDTGNRRLQVFDCQHRYVGEVKVGGSLAVGL